MALSFSYSCRLENVVTSASGYFLCSVIVNPNQCRPSGLPIISDGPLFFDQAKSVCFEQPHQFAEFQNRLLEFGPYRRCTARSQSPARDGLARPVHCPVGADII